MVGTFQYFFNWAAGVITTSGMAFDTIASKEIFAGMSIFTLLTFGGLLAFLGVAVVKWFIS